MSDVDVGVAILNWNGAPLTLACLRSLSRLITPHYPFVVDNGSDRPDQLDLDLERQVEVVALPKNGGVGYGYNAAIRHAAGRGLKYVLLLNNDTLITDPGMLDALLAAIRADDVAAVGPLIVDQDGRVQSAGGFISAWGSAGHLLRPRTTEEPYDVEWLDGAAILVDTAKVLTEVLWDESYFLYWEDVDWSIRLRRRGYRCLVVPNTAITHLGSATVSRPQATYWKVRNGLLFHRRHSSWLVNLKFVVRTICRTVPAAALRGQVRWGSGAALLRAAVSGVGWNLRDVVAQRAWRLHEPDP